ncbi:MAG TPA: 50S ribosomal protein L4 [Candidatus Saccharimonadales bacterium]|nr:50S ribosomal protein L4 [Candidatus Saccharimonadales bacterium]
MATTTTKAATSALPTSVFDVAIPNHQLLKLAYEAYLANGRGNYARTLKRGEVSGGGKKPWKQKGTGRARFGSSRNPIWRKGGIAFGPTGEENYSKQMPLKAKRVALRQALTLANQAKEVVVIDDIKASGKTADMVKWLETQKIEGKRIVIVVDTKTPELTRSTNNLQNVQLVQATYLNVFTILNADKLMMTKPAVAAIESWLGA